MNARSCGGQRLKNLIYTRRMHCSNFSVILFLPTNSLHATYFANNISRLKHFRTINVEWSIKCVFQGDLPPQKLFIVQTAGHTIAHCVCPSQHTQWHNGLVVPNLWQVLSGFPFSSDSLASCSSSHSRLILL